MRAELVVILPPLLDQALCFARFPVPAVSGGPVLVLDDDLVAVDRVGRQPGHPAVVAGLDEARGGERAGRVVDVHACGTVGVGPGADAFAAWGMYVAQVAVVHELPFAARSRFEVERAPADERRFV